jgi:glycerol-3-phosphate dehydrogenase
MRARDLDRLTAAPYDVLVIGGGIYGLALAYEAASRGLRTALVEAGDFGGGTSFNHQKTAHGGLRALQSGRLDRALHSIRERRALARIAPWLLRPLPFLVGTYRSWTRNRVALRGALSVDAWLGRHRNDGVEPELHLPRPRLLSRAATLRLFPGVREAQLTGGAQWYDYQMVEADRLTFAFAAAADRSGADLANYVAATGVQRSSGRAAGIEARDMLSGRTFSIGARTIVNAAGARLPQVMAMLGDARPVPMLKAMNLVTTIPARDIALAAPSSSGRMLTLVPWRGCALVGTSQSGLVAPDALPTVTRAEVEAFVAEVNTAFPALMLTPAQVALVHRGIVPATGGTRGGAELLPEAAIVDHGRSGVPGAFSVIGAKYTTARGTAERTIDLVARALGRRVASSHTASRPLPGAAIADHEALAIEAARRIHLEVPASVVRHLSARYAEAAAGIVAMAGDRPEWLEPVAPGCATVAGEVVHAIRHESAHRLNDIVLRRTSLGAAGHPGSPAIAACARIAATELGWDEARTTQEIADLEGFYRI